MPKSKRLKDLIKSTEEFYTGKKVPKKYQGRYGKKYSKDEAKLIGILIGKKKGWII